jgi:hypothetical protein
MHAADLHNREEIRKDADKRQHTAHRSILCSRMSRIDTKRIGQGPPEDQNSVPR